MPDTDRDQHPDSFPPQANDERSDIEQAVEARSDAVTSGEGGPEPAGMGGEGGAAGVVKDQDITQQ